MSLSMILGKKVWFICQKMRELWRCLCTRWLPLNVPVDCDHGAIVLLVWSQCRGSGCLGQEYETEQTIWTSLSHNLTTNEYKRCLLDKCRIAMDCSVLLCCILCELLYDSSRGEGPIWLLITRKPWCDIASSECVLPFLLVVAFVSVVFQCKTLGTHFPKEMYDSWVTLRVWFVLKISKHPLPITPKHSNKAVDDAEDPTSERPIDGH